MSLTYFAPSTLSEALFYMCQHREARVIAGGTDLLVKHYAKTENLGSLMDIGSLSELNGIEIGEMVRIGALVTHGTIANHPWLQQHARVLAQGAEAVGAPQIRNRGTVGGNLANASPAADIAPPLLALDARIELVGCGVTQVMPVEEFFIGPGRTQLEPGQLIAAVLFPEPKANQSGCYLKLGKRKAMSIAVASIAVQITVACQQLADIRICMGSVASVPLRAVKTEAVLRGQSLNALALPEAQRQLMEEISPIDDIRGTAEYRRRTAGVLFRRALHQALMDTGVDLLG